MGYVWYVGIYAAVSYLSIEVLHLEPVWLFFAGVITGQIGQTIIFSREGKLKCY